MEETVLVIMLRDPVTGFLEKELGSFDVGEDDNLIYNAYAQETPNGIVVYLKLTVDREVEDWEFSAIYDYYDETPLTTVTSSFCEVEDAYNPTWEVSLPYTENSTVMEEQIKKILELHKQELVSVYQAIADQKEAYTSHEDE